MKATARFFYYCLRFPLVALVRQLFPCRPVQVPPARILVISRERIGDLVTSLPVLEQVRRAYPQAEVHCLVSGYVLGLAGQITGTVQCFAYPSFWQSAAHIRGARYDLVIDLFCGSAVSTALLARISGAGRRVGFCGGWREVLLSDTVDPGVFSSLPMPALKMELLKRAGIPAGDTVPRIAGYTLVPDRHLVGIHPGGHFPSQQWPAAAFHALAQRILQEYPRVRVRLIGGPQDRAGVEAVCAGLPPERVETVFPQPQELPACLAGCALLICNNSGPLHLAAALGRPTVSTLGPTDPVRWSPQAAHAHTVRVAQTCSPCSRAVCRRHDCMKEISVEAMFRAFQQAWQEVP